MMVQNMDIVIVISFIMLIEVSVVVSAFSSFRSITTVSPGLVNLYKAQVMINVMVGRIFIAAMMSAMMMITWMMKMLISGKAEWLLSLVHLAGQRLPLPLHRLRHNCRCDEYS